MKNFFKRMGLMVALALGFLLSLGGSTMAATTPDLGIASGFAVLSETFTNTVAGTILNGHLGYITAPAMAPTVNGTTYIGSPAVDPATSAQDAALLDLNAQVLASCTDIGVSLLNAYSTGGNPPGTFSPGCYSSAGTMTTAVGPVTITLSGAGTYIFRPGGTLVTLANVNIVLTGGASACNVFWAPIGATTIGADNNFIGTVIGSPAITVGNNVSRTGRALNNDLLHSVTFSLGNATLTVPTCTSTLTVIKQVVGGTGVVSDFTMNVSTSTGAFVASGLGAGSPGTSYLLSPLNPTTYFVSEDVHANYTQSFTGDCAADGSVTVSPGLTKTCTVTNTYIPPVIGTGTLHVIKNVINLGGGTAVPSDFIISVNSSTGVFVASGFGTGTPGASYPLSSGSYQVIELPYTSYTTSLTGTAVAPLFIGDCLDFTISSGDDKTCIVLNTYIIPPVIPSGGGGGTVLLIDVCVTGDYSASYYDGICYPPVAPVIHAAPGSAPLIAIVKVADRLIPFPYGGGNVVYTYVVTNPGDIPLRDINISDDKCAPLALVGGDVNRDHLLDMDEVRTYTCSTHISVSTRNVVSVSGIGNDITVTDTDFANVIVVPGLPRTGLTTSTPWNIIIFAGVVLIVSSIVFVVIRKRKI